jgi:hypothetical protein
MDKHNPIKIMYADKNGKRWSKDCTIKGLKAVLFELWDEQDFVALVICDTKNNETRPIFKYTPNTQAELIPADNGNNVVRDWTKDDKGNKLFIDMLVLKIKEFADDKPCGD